MKRRYFLRITCTFEESNQIWSMPESIWKKYDLTPLYAAIGDNCDIVERVKTPLPGKPYMWVNENGHILAVRLNQKASGALYPGLIAGVALVDLGTFDSDSPTLVRDMVLKFQHWPKRLNSGMYQVIADQREGSWDLWPRLGTEEGSMENDIKEARK